MADVLEPFEIPTGFLLGLFRPYGVRLEKRKKLEFSSSSYFQTAPAHYNPHAGYNPESSVNGCTDAQEDFCGFGEDATWLYGAGGQRLKNIRHNYPALPVLGSVKSDNISSLHLPQLPKGDYQNWAHVTSGTNSRGVYVCRACEGFAFSETGRRDHEKANQCPKWLAKAYAHIRNTRDLKQLCLICDKKTNHKKWGTFLCSEVCRKSWCFETPQPARLDFALDEFVSDREEEGGA
jgi:hypothetical protein